jgi:N-acetylneuraminic acid mutarotase
MKRKAIAITRPLGSDSLLTMSREDGVFGSDTALEAAGATLKFLPPYSPDLNPIELLFAKLKTLLPQSCRAYRRRPLEPRKNAPTSCAMPVITIMFKPPSMLAALILGAALFGSGALLAEDSGRWSTGAPLPSARTEVSVAEVNGKIYLVGGLAAGRELETYDPATDTWSPGAPIPREVHHAAAVGVDGKLYLIGGYLDQSWTPTAAVHEYDPETGRWRGLAPLPTPRGALAAAALDGRIHVVGGVGLNGKNTNAHESYHPATNRWTSRAPLPTARDHFVAAAAQGRLYAIGGRIDGDSGQNLNANEAYDPAADRWEEKAPLPTARSGIAAAVLDGRIFVVGGEARSGTFSNVEAYDPKTNSWSAYVPMPTARHGLGAAVVDGKLFVIAGGPKPGASRSAANEIFVPR